MSIDSMCRRTPYLLNRLATVWATCLLLFIGGISGCGDVGTPSIDSGAVDERRLEVGVTEEGAYRALTDGEPVQIIRGTQGGYMVLVAFRVFGFESGGRMLVRSGAALEDSGDAVAEDAALAVQFQNSENGEKTLEGYRVILSQSPETLFGQRAVLSFTVSNRDDETIAASADVVITFAETP